MKKTNSLLAVLALCGLGFAVDYTPWSGHATITLNTSATGANVAGGVANFPLLVRLSSTQAGVFTAAKADGADIRFSKADNATALPYQIEHWDQSGQVASIWVLVDAIAGNTAGQDIRMHWGNASAASESNGAAVFATSNGFQAVFHLNKASGNDTDATSNGYVAVPIGGAINDSAAPAAGNHISGGRFKDFAGTGAYRLTTAGGGNTNAALSIITGGTATITAWVKMTTFPGGSGSRTGIVSKELTGVAANTANAWHLRPTAANQFDLHSSNVSAAPAPTLTNAAFATTWTYLAGVRSSNTATTLYANNAAVSVNNSATDNIATTNPAADVVIGGFANVTGTATGIGFLNGKIDEVTISNTARSVDWVALNFASQRPAGQNLYTIGTIVAVSGSRAPRDAAFSVHASATGVAFRLPAGEAGALSVSDVRGRTVWRRDIEAGAHEISWNSAAARGVYLARFVPKNSGAVYADQKITLVR